MRHPIDKSLIARFPVTLVLTHVVMRILTPQQVDVRRPIPVLRRQSHTWSRVGLQQGRVYQVIGIDDTLSQTARHLTVIYRIDYLLRIILTFLPSVATDIIDERHIREFPVHLIKYTVRDSPARFTEDDILLTDAAIAHHRAHQGQSHIR